MQKSPQLRGLVHKKCAISRFSLKYFGLCLVFIYTKNRLKLLKATLTPDGANPVKSRITSDYLKSPKAKRRFQFPYGSPASFLANPDFMRVCGVCVLSENTEWVLFGYYSENLDSPMLRHGYFLCRLGFLLRKA